MKKSYLTFFNQDGGEVRTFGNKKEKEGKHRGGERIRPMSSWPFWSLSFSLLIGGGVRFCFTLFIMKVCFSGQ